LTDQLFALAAGQIRREGEDAVKLCISGSLAIAGFGVACLLLVSAESLAQNAYIPNSNSDTVSVIDTATNKVTPRSPSATPPTAWR
jgi:hypothetical protein